MKGQKGIRILAPMIGVRRKKDNEAEKDITKQTQPVLAGFRSAFVFDRVSRDLRPAWVRHLNRTTPMYCAMAAHRSSLRFRAYRKDDEGVLMDD
jgi:hypothetical protein